MERKTVLVPNQGRLWRHGKFLRLEVGIPVSSVVRATLVTTILISSADEEDEATLASRTHSRVPAPPGSSKAQHENSSNSPLYPFASPLPASSHSLPFRTSHSILGAPTTNFVLPAIGDNIPAKEAQGPVDNTESRTESHHNAEENPGKPQETLSYFVDARTENSGGASSTEKRSTSSQKRTQDASAEIDEEQQSRQKMPRRADFLFGDGVSVEADRGIPALRWRTEASQRHLQVCEAGREAVTTATTTNTTTPAAPDPSPTSANDAEIGGLDLIMLDNPTPRATTSSTPSEHRLPEQSNAGSASSSSPRPSSNSTTLSSAALSIVLDISKKRKKLPHDPGGLRICTHSLQKGHN